MNTTPIAGSSAPSPGDSKLLPRLGLFTAAAMVVGSMIGSGIFKKSAAMAAALHSPIRLLSCWALAGLATCCGALTNAEVAGLFPEAGGQYVYFRRIYNNFMGFLYGWATFAVIQTGSIASISYVFAEYSGYFVPLPRLGPELDGWSFTLFHVITVTPLSQLGLKLFTVVVILGLTGLNILGVALGGLVQSVLTTLKVGAVLALVLLAFGWGDGSAQNFVEAGAGMAPLAGGAWGLLGAMALALSGAFWAYDGWNNVTFIGGELKDPARTLPRALIIGTAVVVAVYLLANLAYLWVLPVAQMAGLPLVAAEVMQRVLGPSGGALISGLVILSTFGASHASILCSARVSYAMAQDGLFFPALGRVHPRFRTPAAALVAQGLWASVLVFSGTFDQITDMLVFVSWIFYALGAAGVFVLRRTLPDAPRPYRVPGYPLVPGVFVLFAAVFVCMTLVQNPRDALLGLLLLCPGLPLYLYRRSTSARSSG